MALRLFRLSQNVVTPIIKRNCGSVSAFELQHKNPLQRKVEKIPKAEYGGRHTVTMLPGGGIGPELMSYVREVFRFAGVPVDFEVVDIDPASEGNDDLEYAITTIRRNGVAIKGNIETKSESTGVMSRNVAIRNELDLYVNVLHCKSFNSIPAHHHNVDVVIVRQNTEGEYAMLEHESVKGVVESMKVITVEHAARVARYAFEFARAHNRKKVTTIHKANIMKLADGLFLSVAREVAKDYPDIQHNDMIIDNCCMQLVSNPHQFDVMNTTNLYGSITSNVKVKKARSGPKTVSEKIHEQFVPKSAQDGGAEQSDEDEASRPRFSEFDENDAELERTAGGRLSDIRKRNITYLDAVDRKYQGQVSSRRTVFHYDDEEESDGESSEDESGYQPGAFVRLKPAEDSDEVEDDFDEEQEEDEDHDDDDSDEDDEDDEDDNDYSLGDFIGDNRTDSQKLLEDENRQESVQKGVCVQNQLKMWERLLEMRIKMQSSLITANSYPKAEKFDRFCQDKQFKEVTDKVVTSIESTLQNLLELQQVLVGRFPESKDVLKSAGTKPKLKTPKSSGKSKIARVDEFESLIRDSHATYKPFRNEVIQKWHDRTKTASSNAKNAAHQSLSIVKKIENALFSKDEVIRKTQLYRGGYKLFEEPARQDDDDADAEENGEPQQIYDEEIFDDSDFYHALLRELIEYKSNTTENPQEINAKLAELQKLRNKMKKQVDTRASKGRKIRYVVHKKLVNFTAPDDDRRWTDDAKNELFSSLFGGTSS